MDYVEGHGPVRTAILKGGSVIDGGPKAEGRMGEILEAVRAGKALKEGPKGTKKYRPERP